MQPDPGQPSGFLSKVLHLVRGAGPVPAAAPAAAPSRLLRQVVAHKRHNEAIRRQEFAFLRQLRQQPSQGQPPARPSGFLPSWLEGARGAEHPEDRHGLPGSDLSDERSHQTLHKIDQIEAQMSRQWWQGQSEPTPQGRPSEQQLRCAPILGDDSVVPTVAAFSMDTEEFSLLLPPDLEEAAILFAHGDPGAARTRLLEQLVQVLNAMPVDDHLALALWHAVLDLCRATGDEASFEPLAIDYAAHFGRSAPLWRSMPAQLGLAPLIGAASEVARRGLQWSCPALLTLGAVQALHSAQRSGAQPWCMSWGRLQSIQEPALPVLTRMLDGWAEAPGQFVWSDAGRLLAQLEQATPVGQSAQSPAWWKLRMAVLRFIDRSEDYEQVALDYCITYEVSPPSWTAPACHCAVQEDGEVDVSALPESSPVDASGQANAPRRGLYGLLEGDPSAQLAALSAQAQPGQPLAVCCEHLIRLDFVAAGAVLNWAADMQAQGYTLRFTQLHRLVAVFFQVIGIHEHAALELRQA